MCKILGFHSKMMIYATPTMTDDLSNPARDGMQNANK